jgi:ABC-2 type transport system permease protein
MPAEHATALLAAAPPAPTPATPAPTRSTPAPAGGDPTRVVAGLAVHKALRSGVVWGCVFGAYVVSNAMAYASAYKTQASRDALAKSFATGGGLNALIGHVYQFNTVAGYTAWKSVGILSVLGALWALLLATKAMRGEEDAGQWELLLSGQTTRRAAAAQTMLGLAAGLLALFSITAVATFVLGHTSTVHLGISSSVFFALTLTSGAALFMALGALTSQLAASRRQAAAYAGGVLGIFFALRMVADATPRLSWLHWATPLGWIEQLQPLTNPQPLVFGLIFGLTALMAAVAVSLAGARDLGASTLPDRSNAEPHTALLSGSTGLTVRLIRPTILAWLAGVSAFGLVLGGSAKEASQSLKGSASVESALARLDGGGGAIKAYLGLSFLIITLLVVLIAAGQITSGRAEEATGRVEHLLVRPLGRARWMLSRLVVAAAAVVAAGALGGIFAWLGVATQGVTIGFANLLGAGLNTVPAGLCLLGLGALAWGITPRLASAAVYGALAWSFLVELLGGIVPSNRWLLDTSLLHQVAPSPAVSPDWSSGVVMIAVGIAAAVLGAIAFGRRDLAGE